jgi:hypothetical protein
MQIRTSQTLPKKYNIFSRIDQLATYGTEDTIFVGRIICIFVIVQSTKSISCDWSMNSQIEIPVSDAYNIIP